MKIPDEMHDRVFGFATSLTNASEARDTKAYWRIYGELLEYCETEARSGRDHPFLWETVADFTADDQAATGIYMKALEKARRVEARDYEASILFALAERYRDMGDSTLAHSYASEANEKAKVLKDLELRRSISEFLLNESKNT